jgi:hypothetical protein
MPVCYQHEVGKFCGQTVYNLLTDMQGVPFSRFAQKLRTGWVMPAFRMTFVPVLSNFASIHGSTHSP